MTKLKCFMTCKNCGKTYDVKNPQFWTIVLLKCEDCSDTGKIEYEEFEI